MPNQQSSKSQLAAPKSILFDRCKESIDAGKRNKSLSLLLTLSELCQDKTEQLILKQLKSRHRIRFEKKPEDWTTSGKRVCGTSYTKDITHKSIQGGRRTNPNTSERSGNPRVSIITVNRNCAVGLEKTIKSVINQKHLGYEIEHIIIDGSSTDDSVDILRKYESAIEYFLSEPDDGIYSAMNKGLSYAQGDVISFLNSDDTYLSHATRVSVTNLERNGVDISYGAFVYTKPNGHVEVVDGPRQWDHSMLIRGIPGGHETFFVKKEIYNLIGGYREDLRIVSDYDWMIRAYLAGCSARPIQSILLQMTMGGLSFDNTVEKSESLQLMSNYLGETDSARLEELYSWKYYLNWRGYAKSKSTQIRLLRMAEAMQDCESTYSKSLVDTINRCAENSQEFVQCDSHAPGPRGLRICMAVTYLNSVAGGAERIAIEAANRLAEEGHAVTLICSHGLSGEPFYQVDDKVRFLDIANRPISEELHKLGREGWEESWKHISEIMNADEYEDLQKWLDGPNKWKTLVYKGFFRTNHFDLVISHMPSAYPYIALSLAGEPCPPRHIAQLHNSPAYKFYSELYPAKSPEERRVRLATLKMCDHVSVLFGEYVDELPAGLRDKAIVLPNFLSSDFIRNPKHTITGKREKSIVTVGRLALQKDQRKLIDAFFLIKDRIGDWKLKIYGEGPLREELELYCLSKGLDPKTILLGRTNNPKAVYESAGMFVLPSRFEGAPLVLMEAMATGTPVVGFDDCPGVKFMVKSGMNGLLASRDEDSRGFSDMILKLVNDEPLRDKLGLNALESAKSYTIDQHIEKLGPFLTLKNRKPYYGKDRNFPRNWELNVAIMSNTISGGAGIAALRLQSGLQKIGLSAGMFSSAKGGIEPSFELKPKTKDPELNPENWRISKRENLKYPGGTIFSSELGSLSRSAIKSAIAYDIINVHWVSHFLSPTSIHWLLESGKPVVWTLHDMLPFTGGCHYTSGCDLFTANCGNCPQIINNYKNHPSDVLKAKSRLWQDRITVISPSAWLANEARKSKVFANSRIEIVSNGIDTLEYQPWDKNRARKILGLPQDKKIILFACHSHAERRKGFQEALMMLFSLSRRRQDLHLITIGRSSDETDEISISNTVFGFVKSSKELSLIYSACDVTVLPSLEDNLPNTILESFACGTPVAAFRAGGIEELVKDGITGHLAPLKDILALRDAVEKCIDSELGKSCRNYAVQNLDCTKQALAYAEVFRSLSTNSRQDAPR